DIYPARELPIPGVTSAMIASEMSKPVHICSKAELLPYLEAQQELAEIILMVGAGDIDRLVRPVIEYLKTK
ncbi:hypothetical protein NL405_27910, partial [Klebsiella pneumoniae]|nr:hypothetical protein [Klebsiella pneumoniae]